MPIVFVYAVLLNGWRGTWQIAALILVLVSLPIIYALMRVERVPVSSQAGAVNTASRNWTRGEVLRDLVFWGLMTSVMAPSFIGTTLFFHQDYLIELRGWDKLQFSLSFTVMAMMTFIFAFVSGFLIDRFSSVKLLPVFLLPLAVACFVVGIFEDIYVSYLFMVLLGVSYGFSATMFGAIWPEVFGTKHLGSIRALIMAMMVFSTAVGPGLTGYLIDIGVPYSYQIMCMGLYCIAASGFMLFVSRKIEARSGSAQS